jgi:tryptophanyl-tRNA synthetase
VLLSELFRISQTGILMQEFVMNHSKKRVLSGIQPSGILHLGNYFGAMKQFVELQKDYESYIFIANYHAMTTLKDPALFKSNTEHVALSYLSIGLDPDNVNLFVQSDIPEVCELTWLLSTITPMGLLERCHSFKDKTAKGIAADLGLFSYPVLMASDILIYQSDIVPVGRDQKQHVEVARDLAIKFNHMFSPVFTVPDIRMNEKTAVVPGIDGQKMSKSYNNFISPFWEDNEIKKTVMRIVTDSKPVEAPKDPDTCHIFALYKLMATPDEEKDLRTRYQNGGLGYGDAKKILLEKIYDYFKEIRTRYRELQSDRQRVRNILKTGADKARSVASDTLKKVRKAVGID